MKDEIAQMLINIKEELEEKEKQLIRIYEKFEDKKDLEMANGIQYSLDVINRHIEKKEQLNKLYEEL